MTKVYKIRNTKTGKFSDGQGTYAKWAHTPTGGKVWKRKQDIKSHIKSYLECCKRYNTKNMYAAGLAEIVELELSETTSYPLEDFVNDKTIERDRLKKEEQRIKSKIAQIDYQIAKLLDSKHQLENENNNIV